MEISSIASLAGFIAARFLAAMTGALLSPWRVLGAYEETIVRAAEPPLRSGVDGALCSNGSDDGRFQPGVGGWQGDR
jgi:hypothetical protein